MSYLALIFMTQIMVSTKAGVVNYVQGDANVSMTQAVGASSPIRTGSGSFAEILLNPGSYVRLDENSEVQLDSLDMPRLEVRVVSGNALIEAAGFDKRTPLKLTAGNVEVQIVSDGIYLASVGGILVLDGKVLASDNKSYGKNWQLTKVDTVRATKIASRQPTSLEQWSIRRSEEAAHANFDIAGKLRQEPNVKMSSLFDVWIWSSGYGGYTYLPGYGFRSPYGYQYLAVRDIFVVDGVVLGKDHRAGNADATDSTNTTTTVIVTPTTPAPRPPAPVPVPAPVSRSN
jgi:hypothetical protein